ncbi:DUF5820 family protein [Halostella sp. PRR32]|uniref:DUF5820 family protein n=1 Tax=Halostella sp. PRR32 TaxID=3098147 RepID=UPI002B1DF987|nr:DUF5820 family protein [Halostella sp. PRR32]
MTDIDTPEGWVVWNEEPDGRVILAYRPDVFDSDAFPAACLPTLYLTKGRRESRRPGASPAPGADWYVTLYLEPDVDDGGTSYGTRDAAVSGVLDTARSFANGEINYREMYQVPREDYFERLDELILSDGPS